MNDTTSQLESTLETVGEVLGVTANIGFSAIKWLLLFLLIGLSVGITVVIICSKKNLFLSIPVLETIISISLSKARL